MERHISARWPIDARLTGLSTINAKLVIEWRKSSQARSLSAFLAPKRKAMLSLESLRMQGSPLRPSGGIQRAVPLLLLYGVRSQMGGIIETRFTGAIGEESSRESS